MPVNKPVVFYIRPPNKGLNTSVPPQAIDTLEASALMNIRFNHGQLRTRDGLKVKYTGALEQLMTVDVAYYPGGALAALIGCGATRLWQASEMSWKPILSMKREVIIGDVTTGNAYIHNVSSADLAKVEVGSLIWGDDIPAANCLVTYVDFTAGRIYLSDVATGTSSTNSYAVGGPITFTTNYSSDYILIDVGEGTFRPAHINSGHRYPTTGYADIMIITNANDGVIIVFAGSNGDPLCAEQLLDDGSPNPWGLSEARAVAIFNNRLVIGGTSYNASELLWSVATEFENFADSGAGSALIGDGPDWIQALRRLGDYLIVYKERSIYIGRKTETVGEEIKFEPAPGQGIGLAAPYSIGDLGEEHIFLGWDDVYLFSLNGIDSIGGPIREELFGRIGSNGILPEHLPRCTGFIVEEYSEYWLLVPTGKIPEATNIVQRPAMDFVLITGDITNAATPACLAISNVSAAHSSMLHLHDSIEHTNITAGAKIRSISGTTVYMDDQGTAVDAAATIWCGNSDGWAIGAQTGSSTIESINSSPFGGICQRITCPDSGGPHTLQLDAMFSFGSLAERTISVVLWADFSGVGLSTDGSANPITLTFTEWDSGETTDYLLHTVELYGEDIASGLHPYIFSFPSSGHSNCFKIEMNILVEETDGSEVIADLHGLQICDITAIDPAYLYQDANGYYAPGWMDGADNPALIPLIMGSVGPWICDTIWVWNYETSAWSVWRMPCMGFGYDTILNSTTADSLIGTIAEQSWRFDDKTLEAFSPTNLLTGVDGQVYEVSSAYSRDFEGTLAHPVTNYWESRDFDMGHPEVDKTFQRVIVYHEISHAPTPITIGISLDSGVSWSDTVVTVNPDTTQTIADFFVTGPQGRMRVYATENLQLTGFSLKLVGRGEINAY